MRITLGTSLVLAMACAPSAPQSGATVPASLPSASTAGRLPSTVTADTGMGRVRYWSTEGDIARAAALYNVDLTVEVRSDTTLSELLINTSGAGTYWRRVTFVMDGRQGEIAVDPRMKQVEERAGVRERLHLALTPEAIAHVRQMAHAGTVRMLLTGGRQDLDYHLTEDQKRRLRDMLRVYDALAGD